MYMFSYSLTGMVTILLLLMYFWTMNKVGRARKKYGIKAPQTTGPEEFERALRVQVNTTEWLLLFLPAMWIFAVTFHSGFSDRYAAALGLVFLVGRVLYARGYYADPGKRFPGLMISLAATAVAVFGAFAYLFYRYFIR